jgi:hypothetical protein
MTLKIFVGACFLLYDKKINFRISKNKVFRNKFERKLMYEEYGAYLRSSSEGYSSGDYDGMGM